MKKKLSIRLRIMGLSLISVFAVALCLTITMGVATTNIGKSSYENEVKSLADSYIANIKAMTSTLSMEIQAAAVDEVVQNFKFGDSVDEIKSELALLASNTYFNDFNIANSDGSVTINGTVVSDRSYFKEAKAGNTYIEGPILRRTDGSIVFIVGTPISNGNVLYGTLSNDILSSGLDAAPLGKGGTIFFINKNSEVIAASQPQMLGQIMKMTSEELINTNGGKIAKALQSEDSGSMEIKDATVGHLYAYYQRVEGTDGWGIAVIGNLSETNNQIRNAGIQGVSISLVLCILACIVSRIVSNKITRAIVVSTERLQKLAEGDLHTEVIIAKTNDEAEILSESLYKVCTELSKYVTNISDTTAEMAKGDFSYSNRFEYVGDFKSISESFAEINKVLGDVILEMNTASNEVAQGTNQISDGTQLLADGTSRQATAVEELTSTIEEMSGKISSSVEAATQVAELSTETATKVEEQAVELGELLTSIADIKEKSEKIVSVIKVIEDIAFQTNILSLNASIEAARAGEAGKGFAVVATEVGQLAAKSAEASKNTADLIRSSIDAVNAGTAKANIVEQKMNEVQEIAKKVDKLIDEIAEAAHIEANAASQVETGIRQINDVVQQNSATAEQTAAACAELSEQARVLSDKVSTLKA